MCLAQEPKRSDAGEARTRGLSVSSQALCHWATALPNLVFGDARMVIPILMLICIFVSNWSVANRIKPQKGIRHQMKCDVINDVKQLRQYIPGYTVAIFLCYPIRGCVTKASALKYELWHEIPNNVVCAASKGSDQPAHMRSLIPSLCKSLE